MKNLLLIICLLITSNVFCQKKTIYGIVFHDVNQDCFLDTFDNRLQNRIVRLRPQNSSRPIYDTTDLNGQYSFQLDTGIFYMIFLIPDTSNLYFQFGRCFWNYYINVNAKDTIIKSYDINQQRSTILSNITLEKPNIDLIKVGEEYCIKNNNNKIKFFKIVNIYNQLIMSFSIEPNNQLFIKKPSSESILILYDLDGTFIKKL